MDGGYESAVDADGNPSQVDSGQGYITVTDKLGVNHTYDVNPYMSAGLDNSEVITNGKFNTSSCSLIQTINLESDIRVDFFDPSPNLTCSDNDFRFLIGILGDDGLSNSSTCLACKPKYKLQTGQMSYTPGSSGSDQDWNIVNITDVSNRTIQNLTGQAVFEGFSSAVSSQNLTLLLETVQSGVSTDSLRKDAMILEDVLQKLYTATTAQVANIYLLADTTNSFEVSETLLQERLKLAGYGLWVTEAVLIIQVFICCSLAYSFRQFAMPRDPSSTSGLATILARSKEFTDSLTGSGSSSLSTIRKDLGDDLFQTRIVQNSDVGVDKFCIEQIAVTKAKNEDGGHVENPQMAPWYRPFIITKKGRVLIIAIAIALIATLEVLWQISSRNDGFLTFSQARYNQYAWRYIPASILVGYSLLLGSLDFEVKTFQPYLNLARGPAKSNVTLDANYHGMLGFSCLWFAARKRQFCIVATSIGIAVAHFLTIASSGLYSTVDLYSGHSIQLQRLDQIDLQNFNDINFINYQTDGMQAATLVLDDDMDLPQWSYSTFIIPELGLTSQETEDIELGEDEQIDVTVTATHAVANCTVIEPSKIKTQWQSDGKMTLLNVTFDSLSACGNDPVWVKSAYIESAKTKGNFASWFDRDETFYHCPEYIVLAGTVGHDLSYPNISSLTCLHCQPYLESMDTTVKLVYPSLQINRTVTPSLNSTTRKFLTSMEIPSIGTNLLLPYENSADSNDYLDGFFGTVVRQGLSLDSIVNNSTALISAVEDVYPQIAAQVLNQNRIAANETNVFTGTLKPLNKSRLQQDGPSTIFLQALLATMALCAAATFGLGQTKRVLPKNPRSIAGTASLLAGSHLLEEDVIPLGAEWCSDRELRDRGMLQGLWFSMGWWRQKDTETEIGDDSSAETKEMDRFGIDVGPAPSK